MKSNVDLQNKALAKYQFNYIVNFYTPTLGWFDFSKFCYGVSLTYTELKNDFTPSTATAKVSFYTPESSLIVEIINAINTKELKCRIFLNSNPAECMFEGYIDYPTFSQNFNKFNNNSCEIEFFDYTYILKSKKIGRVDVISGTAVSGTNNTITLENTASSDSDYYNYMMIEITNGNGISQERVIIDYNGITKIATVDRDWDTIPDDTSVYVIKKRLKLVGMKKCFNADPKNSIVHIIMEVAGFNSSYINVADINNTVPFVMFTEEISCFDALKNLFQSEIMIFSFCTGYLQAKSIDTTVLSTVFTLDNTLMPPNIIYGISEKIESYNNSYKSIRATFDNIVIDNTVRTLFVLQEKDSGYENSQIGRDYNCYKYIDGGKSFPDNGEQIAATLKFNDDCDVIYADDISINIETYETINGRTSKLTVSDFEINGGEVKFVIYNNTGQGDYLLTFEIKGKPVYIKSSDIIVEGDTTEGDSIKIENNWFFTDIDQFKRLVNFYNYILCNIAKNRYTLECNMLPHLEIGDFISVKLKSGYSFSGLITSIEHPLKIDEKQKSTLTVIPVAEWSYNPSGQKTIKHTEYSPFTAPVAITSSLSSQILEQTLTELSQEQGTNLGNYVNTPDKVVINSIVVNNWSITLSWNRQNNLSNFDYYQIQRSCDTIDWFDYDGNLNEYTIEYQEASTFFGSFTTDDPPLGIGYYFRIRQKTKDGQMSQWSDIALATTVPLGKDSQNTNGLIYIDANNFWDFIHKKFRIGVANRYIYFDGSNIYFKSVDLELTTADLITYNSTKDKRMRHTGLMLVTEGGVNYADTLGKVYYDENDNKAKAELDEYKLGSTKFAEKNANSETKITTNELIATKSLVFGVEDEGDNWIKHHTPILYDRKTTNTDYILINIATKIPASTNTFIDITLKQYSLAGGFNQVSNLEARWTGYVYNTIKKFLRARCYLKLGTANLSNPIYAGFWVDGNGYVNLYLSCSSKIFNSYHSYSEVRFNNYYFAKKEYADNWTLTYADTITGYNQDWGVQPIVIEGDTWQYWSGPQLLTSESFTSATNIKRYFTLLKPCTVYAQINDNGTNLSSMYITMIGGGSVITDKRSGHLYTYANYLCPGRYYINISYSSSSNFTLYLYMANANNYNYQGTFTPSHFLYNWSSSA